MNPKCFPDTSRGLPNLPKEEKLNNTEILLMFIRITITKGGWQEQWVLWKRGNSGWGTDGVGALKHDVGLLKEVKDTLNELLWSLFSKHSHRDSQGNALQTVCCTVVCVAGVGSLIIPL